MYVNFLRLISIGREMLTFTGCKERGDGPARY